jgi:hypothetical protein
VSWTPRTDDQPSLAISALAYAPSAPSIIYAGTGNYDNAGSFYPGVGVLRTL